MSNRRFPMIYHADGPLGASARRWAQQFAENGKVPAHHASFPGVCHDEVVAWEWTEKARELLAPVFLRSDEEHSFVRSKMDRTADMFRSRGVEPIEVEASGTATLSRVFSLIALGDWVSLYLACLQDVDPGPVEAIALLKAAASSA